MNMDKVRNSVIALYRTKADFNIVEDYAFKEYDRLDKKGYGDFQMFLGFDVVSPTRIRINFEWRIKSQVNYAYFEKDID